MTCTKAQFQCAVCRSTFDAAFRGHAPYAYCSANCFEAKYKQGRQADTNMYLYMDEIIPGLYLGSEDAPLHHRREAKITHVLSLREPGVEMVRYRKTDSMHFVLHDDGTEPIALHFPITRKWLSHALSNRQHRVLVHCRAGISRSATIVADFLMWTRKLCMSAALQFVCERRQVLPNDGFLLQLKLSEHPSTSTQPCLFVPEILRHILEYLYQAELM